MHHDLVNSVNHFLAAALYEAYLLLLHPDPARRPAATRRLADRLGCPRRPVGAELAAALLPAAPARRPALATRWFADACAAYRPGPLIIDDIALLFEPALELNPVHLFQDASRQTRLIVAWPGAADGRHLSYAVPEHRHYRAWPQPAAAHLIAL